MNMATNLAIKATTLEALPIRRPLKLARNRKVLKRQKVATYPNSVLKRVAATALIVVSATLMIFYL